MLTTDFLVDVLSSRATYEIPVAAIERTTHNNTSFDRTKFEVPAHRWADLSEGRYGVSLLNDCKYGYDIKDQCMRLTLLRAPVFPDPTGDKGEHEFTYSLLPHAGNWITANTVRAGYELNVPLLAQRCAASQAVGSLPAAKSFARSLQDMRAGAVPHVGQPPRNADKIHLYSELFLMKSTTSSTMQCAMQMTVSAPP